MVGNILCFLSGTFMSEFDTNFRESESLSRDSQHHIPGLYQEGGHVPAVKTCYPMTRQGNKHRTALNEQKFFVWDCWCRKSLCLVLLSKFSPRLLWPIRASKSTDQSKIFCLTYVYWTVHHLDSWIKIDQLDVTCFIISPFTAQHISNVSTSIFRS